jgi:hypothetical protein
MNNLHNLMYKYPPITAINTTRSTTNFLNQFKNVKSAILFNAHILHYPKLLR